MGFIIICASFFLYFWCAGMAVYAKLAGNVQWIFKMSSEEPLFHSIKCPTKKLRMSNETQKKFSGTEKLRFVITLKHMKAAFE